MLPNDGRVVSNFIVQCLCEQPISTFGDVDELIEAFLRLMKSDERGPVNLGNPAESTIRLLAERIQALTGSSSTISYEALPQDDPTRRTPDITRARTKLRWEPKLDIVQGLVSTIDYFRIRLAAPVQR